MLNKKTVGIVVGIGLTFSSMFANADPSTQKSEQTEPTKAVEVKEDTTMKSKGNFFKVKTNSVYHYISDKARQDGYKIIWDIGTVNDKYDDGRLLLSENETLIDALGIAVNNLNYLVRGSADNLNLVYGFICPNNKEIVITYSKNAKLVVDKDGYMCKMVTPIKYLDDNNSTSNGNGNDNIKVYTSESFMNSTGVNYNSNGTSISGEKVQLKRDLDSLRKNK